MDLWRVKLREQAVMGGLCLGNRDLGQGSLCVLEVSRVTGEVL